MEKPKSYSVPILSPDKEQTKKEMEKMCNTGYIRPQKLEDQKKVSPAGVADLTGDVWGLHTTIHYFLSS